MEVVLVSKSRQGQPHKINLALGEALLGRAWSSQLLISDASVDAHHARLFVDPAGQVQLQDLGSRNGTWVDGQRLNSDPVALSSASRVQIGKTKFRYYDADDPVPEARAPSRWDDLRTWLGTPSRVFLITLVSLALVVWFGYLENTGKYTESDVVQTLISSLSMAGLFTLVWGGISRLLRGEANLWPLWSVSMLAAAATVLTDDISRFLGFNLQSLGAYTLITTLLGALVMTVSIWGAASIATNLSRTGRWLVALVPIILFVGGNEAAQWLDDKKPVTVPPTLLISLPPAFAIGSSKSTATFIKDTTDIFTRTSAEAARMVQEEQAEQE